jgi:hypothetical protein
MGQCYCKKLEITKSIEPQPALRIRIPKERAKTSYRRVNVSNPKRKSHTR